MDSALYLAGVLAIVVVVWWEIRNDRVPRDGATTGLLAMTPEPGPDAGPGQPVPPPRFRSPR